MADVPVGTLLAQLKLQFDQYQRGLRQVTTSTQTASRTISGAFRSIAGIALPIGIGATFAAGLKRAASASIDFERSMARIGGVLKATGNTAGLTAKQIDEIVRRIDRASLAEASELREAAAALLTFKSVVGDTFERVLTLSQDLAASGFGTLTSNVKQLGKAAESPVAGLTSLLRIGVRLNPVLKEQVKQLDAAGKSSEAFGLILDELTGKVGGVGAAEGTGLVAAWDDFNDALDHWLERSPKINAALTEMGNLLNVISLAIPRIPDADERLAQVNAELERLREQRSQQPAPLPGQSPSGRGARSPVNQVPEIDAKINALLAERAVLEAELKARVDARANAEQMAAERANENATSANKLTEAQIRAQRKAQEAVRDSVASLEVQAKTLAGAAEAAEKGVFALEAYNRQVAIAEAGAEAAAKAIDAGLSGQALGNLVIAAQAAAEKVFDLNNQLEATADSTEVLKKAAEENSRDLERAAEKNAEALAEPFRNAFQDLQTTFTDTFEGLLDGSITKWSDFWDDLKGIAFRSIANFLSSSLFKQFANLGSVASNLQPGATGGGGAGSIFGDIFGQRQISQAVSTGVTDAFGKFTFTPLSAQGGLSSFPGFGIRPAAPGGGLSLGGVSGGGGFSASSLLGGIPIIGGIVAGISAGNKLIKELNLATDFNRTKLEKLAQRVGTILGGIGGGILGAFIGGGGGAGGGLGGAFGGAGSAGGIGGASLFSTLGSFVVGSAAIGQVQVAQQLGIFKGGTGGGLSNVFEAESRLQAVNRGMQLGGPIGAIIGAIAYDKVNRNVGVGTSPTLEGILGRGLEQGWPITRETPFGFIGALGSLTGGDTGIEGVTAALETVKAIDNQLVLYLSKAEEDLVKAIGLPDIAFSNPKRGGEKLVGQRLISVLQNLGIGQEAINALGFTVGPPTEQLQRATDVLAARREFQDLLDAINGIEDTSTAAEAALETLENQIDQLGLLGPTLGLVVGDVEELQLKGATRLREQFDEAIVDLLLGIEQPFALVLKVLGEAQDQRVLEAQKLGADLVEVERLNAIERAKAIEQAFQPVDALLEQLRTGVGILPGVQVEANAETAFRALASQVSAGQFVDPAELANAASLFLDASRNIHASSVTFFDNLALVEDVLEAAKLNLPGFQHGGSFTIPGGGSDNVVPLFRASGGETITISRKTGTDGDFGALVDEMAESRRVQRSMLREISSLREELGRDRAEHIRLSRRVGLTSTGGLASAKAGGGSKRGR